MSQPPRSVGNDAEGRGRGGRSDLHRQAMRRSFKLQVGPAGRGAGRASSSHATRDLLRETSDAKEDWSKKGRNGERNPSPDWDPWTEATPELVSQDRGAGDLRVAKADEHRRILRSAQMGAGSNAGPHFSLGASLPVVRYASRFAAPLRCRLRWGSLERAGRHVPGADTPPLPLIMHNREGRGLAPP